MNMPKGTAPGRVGPGPTQPFESIGQVITTVKGVIFQSIKIHGTSDGIVSQPEMLDIRTEAELLLHLFKSFKPYSGGLQTF